jgi:hypothetical protein
MEQYCKSEDGHEVEVCPNCDYEIELRWNINDCGFQAVCPVCGNRLMLCDACQHRYGDYKDDCDYDSVNDTCKFSRPKDWWKNQELYK